jgi:hypothetical protein
MPMLSSFLSSSAPSTGFEGLPNLHHASI